MQEREVRQQNVSELPYFIFIDVHLSVISKCLPFHTCKHFIENILKSII